MEATRFGFDPSLPPAYKFDPTDADIVAHYLLPRAVGHPNPYAHAVIDADPCSCPPWELMRRHGHASSDHAFFFGPVAARTNRGGRRRANRRVPAGEGGGAWHGQATGVEKSLVLERGGAGGAQMEIKFEKRLFSYYDKEEKRTPGGSWTSTSTRSPTRRSPASCSGASGSPPGPRRSASSSRSPPPLINILPGSRAARSDQLPR